MLDDSLNNNSIEFAKKVVIALVKSPHYNDSISNQLDQELNAFFTTEKIFALNDFFFIKNFYDPSNNKSFIF